MSETKRSRLPKRRYDLIILCPSPAPNSPPHNSISESDTPGKRTF